MTTADKKGALVLLELILVALLVLLIIVATTQTPRWESEQMCIDAGYERLELLAGERRCVGVKDGNSAVESLDDVRATPEVN